MDGLEKKTRITASVTRLFQAFRKTKDYDPAHEQANLNLARLYIKMLSGLPADRVEAAIAECIMVCEYLPPIAAIVKRAMPASDWPQIRAEIAAGLRQGKSGGWSPGAKQLIEHIGLRTLQYASDTSMEKYWNKMEELYEKNTVDRYMKELTGAALVALKGGTENAKFIEAGK